MLRYNFHVDKHQSKTEGSRPERLKISHA